MGEFAKFTPDLAADIYSVPLGPQPQKEWGWMAETTGNLKSNATPEVRGAPAPASNWPLVTYSNCTAGTSVASFLFF